LLSNVLNGSQKPTEIFLNPLTWYEENEIRLKAGVKADSIDRSARVVKTEDGEQIPYDKLIIATGSRPFVPRIEGLKLEDGSDKPGV
ncbi:FAD-dependent oxidoreductase, partial [Acinetobacter baumannii]